jgi:UTP--glucose-1-phosphate uridylyltransferase
MDALERMRADGASAPALAAFARRLAQLERPDAGLLPGDALEPLGDVPALADLEEPGDDALDGVAVLKLNGGLGTSMGLSAPKSTVVAKDGRTFLDVIARQVLALRERSGARLPLVLMDSPATRDASLAALDPAVRDGALPPDFLQGREPKLLADTHEPVAWPADPALEWCPPGHGELYVALAGSGMLRALLDEGFTTAFVSNADNLGAVADPRIAAWVARERVPFAMEVVQGTAADRKGGHLARRDGRIVLRETAQVPEGDTSFGDVERWRWYNTNNLWIDLRALAELMERDPAGPELPLIVNHKTVDPSDPSSPAVLQLENAMGAAIGAIAGARAVHVGRDRFVPVKTTDDLLVLRSDAYELGADGQLRPAFEGDPPFVALDPALYKLLAGFEARFPDGAPSLRGATRLRVEGDVRFGADVVVEGDVTVHGPGAVAAGTILRP